MKQEIELFSNPKNVEYSDLSFNYLAIGNSITKHGLADYWWNESGMAASSEEKDYFHLICSYLHNQYREVCAYAFNFYIWEIQGTDREETFELIDPYLDERLNLVTIQLSENVSDMSTYEMDYEELIRYIQGKAPMAQIIVIDDFWSEGDKSKLKETASHNTNVQFVSLAKIKGNSDYQCGIGTIVYGLDGEQHIVTHEGVSVHPGDKGMKYIADVVIEQLEFD